MKGGEAILEQKLAALRDAVGRLRRVAVAFSGGVDSTFLLRVAHDVLGDDAIAVTARLSTVPDREINEAVAFCRALGVRHEILDFDAFAVPGFAEISPDRCYFCKKAIFSLSMLMEYGDSSPSSCLPILSPVALKRK